MIEYRDRLAARVESDHDLRPEQGGARAEKRTFPDGAVDRITCCRLLKTEALKHTLSGEWPRYRLNHAKRAYELDRNTEPYHRRHRRRPGRRGGQPLQGALLLAPDRRSPSGTSATSRRSSGTSTRPSSRRGPTCGSTRCSTGPSSTSGSTSSGRRSRPCRSTTTRATGKRYRSLGCWPCTHAGRVRRAERGRDHRGAQDRQVRQHRRAVGPGAGQGRRRRAGDAPARRVHVIRSRA